MDNIIGYLVLWSIVGYFMAGALPKINGDKKVAIKQLVILGPLFWAGISIWGVCVFVKRKILA